ncbi:MAG TPA: ferritin [Thermoguttaceae bacterium]|nr:ferritin [Thermoguttaceae bacterium]
MLSPKIQDALNAQVNAEFYSSYLYLSMAAQFERSSLPGMATWMRFQAQEELMHALKFFNFINERNGQVLLTEIEGPKNEWSSALEAFEDSYAHEQKVTGLINDIANLAREEKDHATETFLQWFITEQVEEEASVSTVVDQLKLVGDNGVALFMVDGQLGQRVAPTVGAQP